MSTLKNTTQVNGDASSSIVRATIVQASTVYNDTPKTIGYSFFFILSIYFWKPTVKHLSGSLNWVRDSQTKNKVKIYKNGLLEFAEKAEKLIAEAASNGSELVVFPEGFIGGYPRGFRFGIAVGIHNEDGRDDFRKYHASAIHVPGNINFLHMNILFSLSKKNHKRPSFEKRK